VIVGISIVSLFVKSKFFPIFVISIVPLFAK